jgi:transcriptional regulator with XRE-family HTH domain
MGRKIAPPGPGRHLTGLYYARESRGMSRTELVRLTGVSKQQLSRLENGMVRLRLDHLKPFASALNYSPEQILLWGRYPGTAPALGSYVASREAPQRMSARRPDQVAELDSRAVVGGGGGAASHEVRKDGRHTDTLKPEGWTFPGTFVREELHAPPEHLLVLDITGDSMVPTIASGERVIINTAHRTPSPDGLYAIRDAFGSIVVKRLQLLRASQPTRVKIISDNPMHPTEEVLLNELEIVGKVLCCLKLF